MLQLPAVENETTNPGDGSSWLLKVRVVLAQQQWHVSHGKSRMLQIIPVSMKLACSLPSPL